MSLIIVRQPSTGRYHRGFAGSPGITLCNHSGQRRRMWTRPAKPDEIKHATEQSFCRKCFSPESVRQAKEALPPSGNHSTSNQEGTHHDCHHDHQH
jgi:hypothetical protein